MVLTASLAAYGTSAIVCTIMTLRNKERLNFDLIKQRIGSYDTLVDEDQLTIILRCILPNHLISSLGRHGP